MTLQGKRIVIVGGTSGIGLAVAEGALREGAQVLVGSSRQETIDGALASLGEGAGGFVIDVTDEASVQAAFAAIGAFEHLAFTAGDWSGAGRGEVGALDLEAARAVFAVRYWGAVSVVKHARASLPPGGSITLTDGMYAHRPGKGGAISTSMLAAVEHLAKGLAFDLAPIRVNCVCPGLIQTGAWDSIPADKREERLKHMTSHLPLARAGQPWEAAEAYLYLMRGGYTTGQVLRVDGGGSLV
jgi:NAD(P)-dependent dehydrogenase (short-subunit alcohol dehydrogenase family)